MAGLIRYNSLPDSSRLQIRLRSFLLVRPEWNLPDSLFSSGLNAPVAFLYDGRHGEELTEKIRQCSAYQSQILLILNNDPPLPGDPGIDIIICKADDLDSMICSCDTTSLNSDHLCLSAKELLRIRLSNVTECKDACLELWEKTGRLPNFLSVEPSRIGEAANIVSTLNSTVKIYGAVLENGQILPEIYWENNPGAVTCGFFCFPFTAKSRDLIPYKAGYSFSPNIIRQSTRNWYDMKIFSAIRYDPDFGLGNCFTFRRKVNNEKWKDISGMISHNVKFRKDKEFGWSASFEDRAYIDAGPRSTGILNSGFSIIAWIKLNDPGGKNSILGKGRNFNFAVYQGKLTFSMADDEMDYISEKTLVPTGKWTQVAIIYSKLFKRIDFYLDGKQTDQIDLISEYKGSDHTLLIGNNLWEEFFTGEMGMIKIWDRELNGDEILTQYSDPGRGTNYLHLSLIFLIIAASGAGLFLTIGKRRRQRKQEVSKSKSRIRIIEPGMMSNREKILCFGGLKILDTEGNDICQRFSPKLKQIFTLILLYTHGDEGGITSKQLAEILWPGAGVADTKNIRSTYMQNLRSSLASFKNIKLVFNDKKWFFEFTEDFYDEYSDAEMKLMQLLGEEDPDVPGVILPSLIAMLKKGQFLHGMEESWLDPFIEKMNNRIIEFCIKMFSVPEDRVPDALILDLAEIVSLADPLNEPALRKKINVLIRQGKLSLAKNIYDNFVKLYQELYKEDYPAGFKDIANS
jgi:two-component SAPR family response regulator